MKFIKSLSLMGLALGLMAVLPNSAVAGTKSEDAFAKLKTLVGTWSFAAENGKTATMTYELQANGTALIENSGGMITVFHLDGESLMLTHYCMVGNQPRLRATRFDDANSLRFDFVDITGAKTDHGYISGLTFTWIDHDRINANWDYLDKKGVLNTVKFELTRVKK